MTELDLAPPAGSAGIDVSHHNGQIDWTKAAKAGVEWAVAKATEGHHFADPCHVENMANGRSAGVIMSDYHFARPNPVISPEDQARAEAAWFLARSTSSVAVLDWEATARKQSEGSPRSLSQINPIWQWAWIEAWCQRIYSAGRFEAAVVYTDRSIGRLLASSEARPDTLPTLWLADWTGHKGAVVANTPDGDPPGWSWEKDFWLPTWWQWADQGLVPGIVGDVDMDVAVSV